MTYLVTGGAGFIGSHLVDALLARGDSVVALDNLATGSPANLSEAAKNASFRFVHGSVLDELIVDELVHRCDAVIHMAAAVGVRLVVEEPLRSLITNIRGSQIVIEAAHRYRRKVLMTSTSDIYGKNSLGPLQETADRILGPPSIVRWAYSTAKAVDEILANCYHREHDLATVVVRLFNTVGPRQSAAYGMVVPRLVRQAVRGEPLTVYGDGRQTRCFTHVSDIVDALLRLLDEPAAIGQTYNVGASREISIRELAEMIIARTGSASAIRFVPYDQAYESGFEDMQRKVPDTSKLRVLTGWLPRRSLDDILTDAIGHARRELAARARPSSPHASAMRT
ncbi:GDP-mannose 4,6-dehydratase [Actinoallomurus spadix]|uniref:GDP-mannose 4,6-dehydratase n=1 Tax=Actinoallomurus spadix TaxID=79912 RepID=A0ABN0WZ36_9ACTN|nr:NAD-dependent epimerase/dehydratase family protein [Actinoallomurus spadix]MCO5989128.1 GDP-mannose 4,6-dehydratase [Actinoallomurus spadix]